MTALLAEDIAEIDKITKGLSAAASTA